MTINQLLVRHIELRTAVGGYTTTRYGRSLKDHFGGDFGSVRADALNFEDVALWVKQMQNKGLAPKTVKNHFGFLSAAMKTAVRLGIRTDNPCTGVRLPNSQSIEAPVRIIKRAEWDAIIANTPDHYRPFFGFLRVTGMRFSEATALNGSDFDFTHVPPLVHVTKAWKMDERNESFVGPPKTAKSRRDIALTALLTEEMKPLVLAAGNGLVFRNTLGGRILSSAIHKVWGPACLKAGFTNDNKPRLHDCRHTSASMFLHGGADLHALSRRLGHQNITMTAGVYGHLMPEEHQRLAEIGDAVFQ
ncbi:tyrosine-type recombinase/integrase [Arthrobacter sp. TMN-37]